MLGQHKLVKIFRRPCLKVNKLLSLINSHHLDCCMQKTNSFHYKMAALNFDNKNKTPVIKYVKLVSVRI